MKNNKWEEANAWESSWWGDCLDTVSEEIKQRTYANRMGLPLNRDLSGKSVLDIGGGPVSLLLKFKNRGFCTVADPLKIPHWVEVRYEENSIEFVNKQAESLSLEDFFLPVIFDEVWIYNVLQHVENPRKIVKNALGMCKIVRIFEWVDIWIAPGHIHVLTEKDLNKWLGGEGKVEQVDENGCRGTCYYGVFKGDHYEEI